MGSKYKPQNNTGAVKAVVAGVVTATLLMLGCVGIIASLIEKEHISTEAVSYIALCVQFAAAFFGSFTAGKMTKNGSFIAIAATAAVYCFLLMAITIIGFDGAFQNVWRGMIAIAAGMGVTLLLNFRKSNKVPARKRKVHSR